MLGNYLNQSNLSDKLQDWRILKKVVVYNRQTGEIMKMYNRGLDEARGFSILSGEVFKIDGQSIYMQ